MKLPALTGIITMLVGLVYSVQAFALPKASIGDAMAPKVFPIILGVTMVLLGAISFIKESRKNDADEGHEHKENKHTIMLIVITCVSIFIYALIFEHLGYVISTVLFMCSILFPLNGKSKWKANILVSVIFSVTVYLIFMKLLAIPLPLMPILEI